MSNNVGEHQTHQTLSTIAPRKRPRQELACDVDPGLIDNEGAGGSGSVSSEPGENDDARQGGSQKRARSEGHGDSEVSRDSISWPRNPESRGSSLNASLAVSSSATRLSSEPTTASRYINSAEPRPESPEESFISLPPILSAPEAQRSGPGYSDNRPLGQSVQNEIARSMAFDEQMDALRRSPVFFPSSPMSREQSHSAELAVDPHAVLDPEPSASPEGDSRESTGDLEASASEFRAQRRLDQSSTSSLHTLANTASMHSRILHTPTSRMAQTLPPILSPLQGHAGPPTASDAHLSIFPRLRMVRRHDQSHPRRDTRSSSSPEIEQDRSHPPMRLRESSQSTDEDLGPTSNHTSSFPPALPSSPTNPAQHADNPSVYPINGRNRLNFSRRDLLHEMNGPFNPFESHERPPLEGEDSQLLDLRFPVTRRTRRQRSSLSTGSPASGPFELHTEASGDNHGYRHAISDDPLVQVPRGLANGPGPRNNPARTRLRRQVGSDDLPGSFWNGIFDETDSERDASPRRTASLLDDNLRRSSYFERDVPSTPPRSVYDMFRDNLRRRSSPRDSPRPVSGQLENAHVSHTTSSSPSSSSMSSFGRSTSRSLLDPTLSFGAGWSAVNTRSSLSSSQNQDWTRPRTRARLSPWFNQRSMEEADPVELDRSAPGSERRHSEGLITVSSAHLAIDSPINEDQASPSGSSARHINNLRETQTDAVSARLSPVDPDHALHAPNRATYGFTDVERPASTHHSRSSALWESDSVVQDIQDARPPRPVRRHFSPVSSARQLATSSAPRLTEQPLPAPSRFRLRRTMPQDRGPPTSGVSELPVDSMEGVIPESNTRESDGISALFRRRESPLSLTSASQPFRSIDPPPRPVEPRILWNVGPCPVIRTSPRRTRSPSPPLIPPGLRQGRNSPENLDFTTSLLLRSQQPITSQRTIFDRVAPSEQPLAQRQATPSVDADERRLPHAATNVTRLDSLPEPGSSNHSPARSLSSPTRHGNAPHLETFNELIRRRAARVEAQARANRRPLSPETMVRPTYRLPRPSFLADNEDSSGRRDCMARPERRSNTALSGTWTPHDSSLEDSRRERRTALLLGGSIPSGYTLGDRPFNRHEWDRYYDNLIMTSPTRGRPLFDDQEERNDGAGPNNGHPRISERSARQRLFSTTVDAFGVRNAEETDGGRERQELHEAIGRRSRDDELSTRRSLAHMDRTRRPSLRDPMSTEATRNVQRRLRESEAEGRARRAPDQWGELEDSGELDADPTQSRMHRFGEAFRRRRAPNAFGFSDSSMDQERVLGSGSSSTRIGRRSPSPSTAAPRLSARQARFARAQGRLREMGAETFSEYRSRGSYASRLDMFGGSFPSRYIIRNLGDYVRDEDFDASYEGLLRLAAAVGDAKSRGTPAHLLAAMPTGFYKDFAAPGSDRRCPICLDDYKDLDPVLRISDCDHWFHKECLEQWLSGENSCPICRRRVRGRGERESPNDVPGPSGSRRDDGSDDEAPGRVGSPELTLEELSSYASGWVSADNV